VDDFPCLVAYVIHYSGFCEPLRLKMALVKELKVRLCRFFWDFLDFSYSRFDCDYKSSYHFLIIEAFKFILNIDKI